MIVPKGSPGHRKIQGFKAKEPEILLAAGQLLGNTAMESAYSTSPQQKINKIHKDTERTNQNTTTLAASSEKNSQNLIPEQLECLCILLCTKVMHNTASDVVLAESDHILESIIVGLDLVTNVTVDDNKGFFLNLMPQI